MCKRCGGGGSRNITPKMASAMALTAVDKTNMVEIEYIGEAPQKQRINSRAVRGQKYTFDAVSRRFFAYESDVPWLLSMEKQFKRAAVAPSVAASVSEAPVLVAQRTPAAEKPPVKLPISALPLDPITIALLKREYSTIDDVRRAGPSGWMSIKGIGASRATQISEALNELEK